MVLILAVVLISATVVATLGAVSLQTGREYAESQRGEYALSEFDARTSAVALEGAGTQTIDLAPHSDAVVDVRRTGWLKLVLNDTESGTQTVVMNRTLGTVVHESGNRRVAFQAGGIWRGSTDGDGSAMVSPPEIHYTGQTLTLPLVTVNGSAADVRKLRVEREQATTVFPVGGNSCSSNPVNQSCELLVVVKSDYFRAWHQFFESRIGGDVFYPNGTSQQAAVRLTAVDIQSRLAAGLTSVGTSDRVTLGGAGNSPSFVDSYNSSSGVYSSSQSGNGTVSTVAGLKLSGSSFVNGSISTAGQLTLKNSFVFGNAAHQGLTMAGSSHITGWENKNGTGDEVAPIDAVVASRVNHIEANNDNNNTSAVDADGNLNNSDPLVFDSGSPNRTYYVGEDMDVKNNEKIIFDLQDGNISLALDGNLELKGNINVENDTGNHFVKIWFAGDLVKLNKGNVTVLNQTGAMTHNSRAFRLLGPSDTDVELRAGSGLVGVVFAPSKPGASGSLVMKSSEVFGAAVVGEVDMNSGSSVHYDRSLGGIDVVGVDVTTASELSYLHVSVNEVRVTPG